MNISMLLLKKILIYSMFYLLCIIFFACKNTIVILEQNQTLTKNKYWINNNTLQLVIEEQGSNLKIPITDKRELSCSAALSKIKTEFTKLYPKYEVPQTAIKYTMFLPNGGCKIIVWYNETNLKNKL